MVKADKLPSVPAQADTKPRSTSERFVISGALALAEPNVRPMASPLDDLDDAPPGRPPGDDLDDGEARPRTRKPRARPVPPDLAPPHNPPVVKGDDLNGLLLIMLLEMQEYWGGTIRPEVARYLAQQLSERSGGRFHGLNTTSMAAKVREFVEQKHWLEAKTHHYALTDRGRTIARLCQRQHGGKSSGEMRVTV